MKKQLRKLFYEVYKIAESEAAARRKPLTREAIVLLRILAAKYRAGLQPHLELIARYIGQGLLINEVQLEGKRLFRSTVQGNRSCFSFCSCNDLSCKDRYC